MVFVQGTESILVEINRKNRLGNTEISCPNSFQTKIYFFALKSSECTFPFLPGQALLGVKDEILEILQ